MHPSARAAVLCLYVDAFWAIFLPSGGVGAIEQGVGGGHMAMMPMSPMPSPMMPMRPMTCAPSGGDGYVLWVSWVATDGRPYRAEFGDGYGS